MSPPTATGGKSSEFLTNNFDELDNAFFDEFITFSPTNDGLPDPEFSEQSDGKEKSSETLLGSLYDANAQEIEDNWQGDPWGFAQDSASPDGTQDNLFYAELSGRAAISDSDLLSLEDISLQSPQIEAWAHPSLPTSPAPAASTRRKSRVEALANTMKKVTTKSEKSLRSPIRKSITTSSAMLRGSSNHGKMSREALRRKLALDSSKFSFNPQHQSLISPPQSARISNASEHTSSMKKVQKTEGSEELWTGRPQDLQFPTVPADYNTPLSTPNLDNKRTPEMRFHQSSSNGSMYPITPKSQQQASSSWSQLPGSSNFSPIGVSSEYPVEVEADGSPVWWNHAATPMAQPSPNTLHRNPQRATKSLAFHLQNELSYTTNDMNMAQGLMISMPENMPQQSFVVESSPMLHQGYFNAGANGGGPQPHAPYHSAAPRTHSHSHSHSHYSQHPASSSRKPHYSHSKARKPRAGSSGSESPSANHSSSNFHVRKQRKSKNRNTSPRTPTSGRGTVDFVNYTPDDSRKILTGVAPSGSSKTKARREKEAMEKRRKLSQAALNAIRAAGGDVGSLVEEGLFV
ncbi:hypothetical protein MFRU_008g03340 [Monilinia fructicola]|nr:hypothetical protein MFRU_008g03340 [Monilinia fructicola]